MKQVSHDLSVFSDINVKKSADTCSSDVSSEVSGINREFIPSLLQPLLVQRPLNPDRESSLHLQSVTSAVQLTTNDHAPDLKTSALDIGTLL